MEVGWREEVEERNYRKVEVKITHKKKQRQMIVNIDG